MQVDRLILLDTGHRDLPVVGIHKVTQVRRCRGIRHEHRPSRVAFGLWGRRYGVRQVDFPSYWFKIVGQWPKVEVDKIIWLPDPFATRDI